MATYKSLFKVQGTLDDINFYKSEDGYLIRTKGGIDAERIKSDPNFERTRENNAEFGSSATSGKRLRRAILDMVSNAKDSRLSSRLTQVMTRVKNQDATSPRGKRHVAVGIQTPLGKGFLKGFNFNRKAPLEEVLLKEVELNTTTGEMVIQDFIPIQHLSIPEGATHVEFFAGFLNLDFETGDKDFQPSNKVNLPVNGTASTVTLTPLAPATGTGQAFYCIKLTFFQEVNTVLYPLRNGEHNVLHILNVI